MFQKSTDMAEAVDELLACPVSLLYNQNSAFDYDGIVYLIRRCHHLPFI